MKKITKEIFDSLNLEYIFWDLDGTLIDSEIVWYNMDKTIAEKYNVSGDDIYKYYEKEAADMYNNIGYRLGAKEFLNSNDKKVKQIIINACPLTNDAMYSNKAINDAYKFSNFDKIISNRDFQQDVEASKLDLYNKAIELNNIKDLINVIAFEDLPEDLKIAKKLGFITVWAKNSNYPFNEKELETINQYADYYIEDFSELI